MVFKFLLRFLLSEKVVNKLADSYPIRRAAQWMVFFAHKVNAKANADAVKTISDKFSLKEDILKNLPKITKTLISFLQSKVKSIKPLSSTNSTKLNESQATYSTETIKKNESSNLNKSSSPTDAEQKLKAYIEELKKRSQQ